VLTSLVWLFERDHDPERATVQAATPHLASKGSDDPPAPDCPASPSCPPASSELQRDEVEPNHELAQGSPASAARAAEVQAMVSEAMTSVSVSASFDLDCAARPCLAVFAGEIPDEEERSAVIQRLVESHPGIHLRSSTIVGETGVSWVLGLADEEPTREEEALIEVRIEDLLIR
jgi:hypothetical protein